MEDRNAPESTTLLDLVVAVNEVTSREEEAVRAVLSLLEDRRVQLVGEFLEQHLQPAIAA